MSELPRAEALVVERARDAHDPTDLQTNALLSALHARLDFLPDEGPAPTPTPELATPAGRSIVRASSTFSKLGLLAALAAAAIGALSLLVHFRARPQQAPGELASHVHAPELERTHAPSHVLSLPSESVRAQDEGPSGASPAARASTASAASASSSSARQAQVGQGEPQRLDVRPLQRGVASHPVLSPRSAGKRPELASTVSAQPTEANAEPPPAITSQQTAAPVHTVAQIPTELDLIDRAVRALRDHQPALALSSLQEHGARYPKGQLASERRGLRVLALCAVGERTRALQEADAFLREEPGSPLVARVAKACRTEAAP